MPIRSASITSNGACHHQPRQSIDTHNSTTYHHPIFDHENMPTRKRSLQASHGDSAHRLKLLKESYHVLKEFQKDISDRTQTITPKELASAGKIICFNQLIDNLEAIMNHKPEDPQATKRLIEECPRWCEFFRYQVSHLYSLPLKNILLALNPSNPILSSPILGLMSYVYHIKLKEPQVSVSVDAKPSVQNQLVLTVQNWEKLLVAFGEGIKLHMSNARRDPKLTQFQVLIGKVFYPFLGEVMGDQISNKTPTLSQFVTRALLEAGEALSGGCAQNKELIRDPTTFGPAILSHMILEQSDFITANLALQLAFAVAPVLRMEKSTGKTTQTILQAKRTREEWFKKVFPVSKFGKSVQGELVPQLSSMSSKQFWVDLGEIQAKTVVDDNSRACALPIESGTLEAKQIQLNNLTAPVLGNTVQFNRGSLTWSSLRTNSGSDDIIEATAEICFEAITTVRLEGISQLGEAQIGDPMKDCKYFNLVIEFTSDSEVVDCIPSICYPPINRKFLSVLVLKFKSQHSAVITSTLKNRKLDFSCVTPRFEVAGKQGDNCSHEIFGIDFVTDIPQSEEDIERESSKLSISKDPVCCWEATAIPNSGERVTSVQREASIQSFPEAVSSTIPDEKSYSATRMPQSSPSPNSLDIESKRHWIASRHSRVLKRKISKMASPPRKASESSPKVGPRNKIAISRKRYGIVESPVISMSSSCQARRPLQSKQLKNSQPASHSTIESKYLAEDHLRTKTSPPDDLPEAIAINLTPPCAGTSLHTETSIFDSTGPKAQPKKPHKKLGLASEKLPLVRKRPEEIELESTVQSCQIKSSPCTSIGLLDVAEIDEEPPESRRADTTLGNSPDFQEIISEASEKLVSETSDQSRYVKTKDRSEKNRKREFRLPFIAKSPGSVDHEKRFTGTKKKKIICPSKLKPVATKADGNRFKILSSKLDSPNTVRRHEESFTLHPQEQTKIQTFGRHSVGGSKPLPLPQYRNAQPIREVSEDRKLIHASDIVKNLTLQPRNHLDQGESHLTIVDESSQGSPIQSSPRSVSPQTPKLFAFPLANSPDTNLEKTNFPSGKNQDLDLSSEADILEEPPIVLDKYLCLETALSKKITKRARVGQGFVHGKRDGSRPSREKKLRFESPRQPLMKEKVGFRASNPENDYEEESSPSQLKGSPTLLKESPNLFESRKQRPEVMRNPADGLKSALKDQTSSEWKPKSDPQNHYRILEKRRPHDSPELEMKKKKHRGIFSNVYPSQKLSEPIKCSPAALRRKVFRESSQDSLETKAFRKLRKRSGSPVSDLERKRAYLNPSGFTNRNNTYKILKHEPTLTTCMNKLTEMVMTSIRNKKVKIEGAAATTRSGVFHLTNNLIEDSSHQTEGIMKTISLRASQRENQYEEYYNKIQQCRKKMEHKLEWLKTRVDERKEDVKLF